MEVVRREKLRAAAPLDQPASREELRVTLVGSPHSYGWVLIGLGRGRPRIPFSRTKAPPTMMPRPANTRTGR